MSRAVFKNRWLPYFLVLPQLLVTIVFFFWPSFNSLKLSVLRVSPFGDKSSFAGWRNFELLLSSPEYHRSIFNTLVFSAAVTFLCLAAGLLIAMLINQRIRGLPLYRTLFLMSYGIAPPIAGYIWMFLFHPAYGLLPYLLSFVTKVELNWLVNGGVAMALVILTATWTHLGYNVAFYLAGLQLIPGDLLDAASVDGASPLKRFWRVTFPLLSPVTFFLFIMNLIYSLFDTFGVIHAVTTGGPGGATEIMVYKAYRDGFLSMNLGSSAAQSVILMLLAIILTALQFHFTERRVTY